MLKNDIVSSLTFTDIVYQNDNQNKNTTLNITHECRHRGANIFKMSDLSSEKANLPDGVCRDYLRNVCNRGKKCRFKHPPLAGFANSCLNPQEEKNNFCKTICHDYQNTGCSREGCKYVHCSKDDQASFLDTGLLSSNVLEDAIMKAVIPSLPGDAPVCRDYLSGECRRGKSCRFRHLSHCKYRKELEVLFGVTPPPSEACPTLSHNNAKRIKSSCSPFPTYPTEMSCLSLSAQGFSQSCLSRDKCNNGQMYMPERLSATPHYLYEHCQMTAMSHPVEGCCERFRESHMTHHPTSCLDENSVLKKQVFELRRQVTDLMTANEFLLEQNAALRMMRKNGGLVALQPSQPTTLNVQSAPGQQLVASAVPVSIAQVTGPGAGQMTLSTMAMTGQASTQQLVPVSCHAPGQQIMAAVNTVTVAGQTGSPALLATAVPVSVSSTASQLVPVSAVPVSLATVSMAPVHIPPIVTAASEPPHSIAMSVSAATSLVSYPIMTQPLLQTR